MEQDKVIPLDAQRRLVAYQTAKSWEEVPHVAYLYEPDATEFYQAYLRRREELSGQGLRLTLNTLLLKAVAEGLKAAPLLNAHFAFEKGDHSGEIRVKKEISPSVPWLLEGDQMLTVTVPEVGSKTLKETAEAVEAIQKNLEMTDLPQLMRDVALGRDSGGQGLRRGDILGGTVTVSNLGPIYRGPGQVALLEILPPQVFAVGISALQEKPGVYTDQRGEKAIGVRRYLPMCLAFDHRVMDFSGLVPFLKRMDEIFASPAEIGTW